MNEFRIKRTGLYILVAASFLLSVHCSQRQVKKTGYTCTMHGTHHATDRRQLAECLEVSHNELELYYLFREKGSVQGKQGVSAEAVRVKDRVKERIVNLMVRKLEGAIGQALYTRWRFDSMSVQVPVKFREFRKTDGDMTNIIIIGAIKKNEFEPRNVIKYLPLEYKMQIMEDKDE
ncbi:MAG: hypothetical protein ACOCX9_06885 [Spirochaetota bacterium]